nr:JmjC domain-containing protein [Tanacetum cinerariifolium]
MATLRYRDEHNKVGYLLKPIGSHDYHRIIDFLRASHIRSPKLGPPAIQATIDKTPYTITEDLVWSRLQLANDGGIFDLPIAEIYSRMDNLGTKSGSWDQFGSPLFVAFICLSDGRRFNWSNYIFKGMVSNIGNAKKFLTKLFANMRLNFEGHPMPLLLAMLLQDQAGEGAEHGQSSDPNASFSRSYETDAGPFTNVKDAPVGGSFHISLLRSTQAPPAGQPSGGVEDPITLIALSFIVSTLVQKVYSLETKLNDHKKLFKDVVEKLVKKVKPMEVKLKTKKSKMVVSDSDEEDGEKKDVDLDALRALANAAVTVDSNIPPGGTSQTPTASLNVPAAGPLGALTVPPGASTVPAGSPSVPVDVSPSVAPAGVSNKGKSPMVKEDSLVKARIFKQMQEDILGEQAAKRLHDEEQAQLDRQREKLHRQRQEEVLDSAMYYNEADWRNIMAQVEANASQFKTLLGDDVSEDNFPARMATLIKRKKKALAEKLAKERQNRPMTQAQQRAYMRQFVKNQSSALYTIGWSIGYVKSFTDDQLKEEFEKIRKFTKATISSVLEVPHSPAVSSPPSSSTQRKSLGRKRLTKPKSTLQELDLDTDDQTFIKVVSTEDSKDEAPPVWYALVGWEETDTTKNGTNLSKNGQNQAQNEKREKSQQPKVDRKSNPKKVKADETKLPRKIEVEGPKVLFSKVSKEEG